MSSLLYLGNIHPGVSVWLLICFIIIIEAEKLYKTCYPACQLNYSLVVFLVGNGGNDERWDHVANSAKAKTVLIWGFQTSPQGIFFFKETKDTPIT